MLHSVFWNGTPLEICGLTIAAACFIVGFGAIAVWSIQALLDTLADRAYSRRTRARTRRR